MTNVTLLTRPTLSNTQQRDKHICEALKRMDRSVTLLRFAADSACMSDQVDEELIQGLYHLQSELRRDCDGLYALL